MDNDNKKIPTLLVIEDDLLLLKAYGIKFKQEGWNTVLLSEGATAIDYLAKTPPDIVLLDIVLPGTSGFELLEAMRRDDEWKNTPVFVLTNSEQEDYRVRAEKLGVIDYIVKVNSGIDDIVKKIKEFYLHETSGK